MIVGASWDDSVAGNYDEVFESHPVSQGAGTVDLNNETVDLNNEFPALIGWYLGG